MIVKSRSGSRLFNAVALETAAILFCTLSRPSLLFFSFSSLPGRRKFTHLPRRKVPFPRNVHHTPGNVLINILSQHRELLALLRHRFFPLCVGWPDARDPQLCYHRFNDLHIMVVDACYFLEFRRLGGFALCHKHKSDDAALARQHHWLVRGSATRDCNDPLFGQLLAQLLVGYMCVLAFRPCAVRWSLFLARQRMVLKRHRKTRSTASSLSRGKGFCTGGRAWGPAHTP